MIPDSDLVATLSPSPNFNDRRGRPIDCLILHYTGMSSGTAARSRLLDADAGVSCHYLVWEDGRIEQLVAEADRAWHAGRSFWAGERDINAVSVGIEIVNAGHEGGCPPYPADQIAAVTRLGLDICCRHAIRPDRVLAHSDVAPDRKEDPGEYFPWAQMAADGLGIWVVDAEQMTDGEGNSPIALDVGAKGEAVAALQRQLADVGYDCPIRGIFDDRTALTVRAFQRHYRPAQVDGKADVQTLRALKQLCVLRL